MPDRTSLVGGAFFSPRRTIGNPRGDVLHFLKKGDFELGAVGEIYFSKVLAGSVKAWKRHTRMTQRLTVPTGRVRFVLFDEQRHPAESWSEIELGAPDHHGVLVIPPGVWYGFGSIGREAALVANCADLPHDPGESESADVSDERFPRVWHRSL